ncbi:MAG: hypothetical protein M1834_008015 [Cirrosporium novae-zelandiae]|nr:MAG: hypothetical protein M1834_008015 [Cirrosporium novae-zelandiae]
MECLQDNFQEGRLLDGRFVTVSPLNHGSFGMVFLARDLLTNEHVAIKCLTKASAAETCPNSISMDDCSEELAHHKRLGNHPNIVNLVDSFETEHHTYIVLEYCSMGDLYEAIRHERGPLQTENVRDFMIQLIDAVEYIHSKGLYHRDIKPENIFLAQDGSMKLGDFGLATTDSWSYEACVGSDRYMAPEQYDPSYRGYSPVKADIWSVGVCLLNVLFSRNPFVTPTESDVLFADFKRDNQSLFDVFPTMSQDTFEILTHCMAMDPMKRSLRAVRQAVMRVVSFTTDDEALDDFCTEDRAVIAASANREPLRTPSIQSPEMTQGGFPWAQVLHSTPPQPIRQLSAIPDTEIYNEDLFPSSEQSSGSWMSVAGQTPTSSTFDSALGTSVKSNFALSQPINCGPPRSDPVQITGSLPSQTSKPFSSMSMVFGKNSDAMSKSWSDLWEEDEEDLAKEEALKARREKNSRTWSQESKDDSATPRARPRGLSELKGTSVVNTRTRSPDENTVDLASTTFEDVGDRPVTRHRAKSSVTRHSPPPKKDIMDKWAALGNRRRAYQATGNGVSKDSMSGIGKAFKSMNWRRDWGLGSSGFDYGAWDNRKENGVGTGGWQNVKDWRHNNIHSQMQYQQPLRHLDDDIVDESEWVGGYSDLHL